MRLRIVRMDPSFLDLVNAPDRNVLFSVTFALANIFLPLSNATSVFTINFSSCESRNANLELDFGVAIRPSFSPFSIISRTILSLVTFFHLVKWFLRFLPLKFWISLFSIGIISCWNFKTVIVPTLIQLSFSCGIVIDDTPVVVFGVCFNLRCGCWCCSPWFDLQRFLEIFASSLNFYSKEDWNRSATFFWLVWIVPILSFNWQQRDSNPQPLSL